VTACAFAALGLCFTALVPTIDHVNLPIFLVVLVPLDMRLLRKRVRGD
jgi:hypothetical protein